MPARRGSRTKKAASRPAGARRNSSPRAKTAKQRSAGRAATAPATTRKSAKTRAAASKPARPSSARRATAKRTTKNRVAPKAAAKRATPARSAAPRSAARAAAKRASARTAPKAAAQRATPARRAAPRSTPAPKPARRAPAPAPAPGPSGIVYTKPAIVAALHAGRDAVFAACRELTRETWEAPIAPGKWNPRQIVAHLAYWDIWLLDVLPAAANGVLPEAPSPEQENDANKRAVAAAADLDADATLEAFLDGRAEVLSAVTAIPEEPASRWRREHALGRVTGGYPAHDHHHAAQIRAAATRRAFAPQRAGASEKELLLFELQRARVALVAAVKGIAPHAADRPVGEGKWSPRELVLHCAVRDRVRLEEFDAVLAGAPVSWAGLDDAAMARENERHLAELRHLAWDDALALLLRTRDELVQRLLAVPAGEAWIASHPFGGMLRMLPPHDRKHADQIKHARIAG